jgi:polysaccharide biosynthesis transport protein
MGEIVDLRSYLAILAKRAWLIVSVVVMCLAAAAGSILLMTPTYRGDAQLFVSTQISSGNLNQELFQGSNFSAERVKSYSQLVTSPTVLDPVIAELSLPLDARQLADHVSAKVPLETVMIDISATSDSPEMAAAIANSVANSLAKVIGELESSETRGSSPVKATVVTPAMVPASPSSPSIPINLGLGLLVGLIAGVGLAVLLEKLNTSVKDTADLAAVTDIPVLAHVVRDTRRGATAIVRDDHLGSRSEAYRQLRTNLQFAAVDRMPKVIVVTSALAGEGKSSVAGNLAVAMSHVGVRVCLVDGDLRRPSVASYFKLTGPLGLSNALVGRASLDQILQPVDNGFAVITSGPVPPNPAELLSSKRFPGLLRDLTEKFEVVLIDAPPTLPAADAVVLAALADAVLFVVQAGKTTMPQMQRALKSLEQVNARVLGTVLNMVPSRNAGKSRYWYGTGYTYRPHAKPVDTAIAEPRRNSPRPAPQVRNGTPSEHVSSTMVKPPRQNGNDPHVPPRTD